VRAEAGDHGPDVAPLCLSILEVAGLGALVLALWNVLFLAALQVGTESVWVSPATTLLKRT